MGQTQASPGPKEPAPDASLRPIRGPQCVESGPELARKIRVATIPGTPHYTGLASSSPIEGFPPRPARGPSLASACSFRMRACASHKNALIIDVKRPPQKEDPLCPLDSTT